LKSFNLCKGNKNEGCCGGTIDTPALGNVTLEIGGAAVSVIGAAIGFGVRTTSKLIVSDAATSFRGRTSSIGTSSIGSSNFLNLCERNQN